MKTLFEHIKSGVDTLLFVLSTLCLAIGALCLAFPFVRWLCVILVILTVWQCVTPFLAG